MKKNRQFEELSPARRRDSPAPKGRQVPCRSRVDSPANSAVNDRDCAPAAVQPLNRLYPLFFLCLIPFTNVLFAQANSSLIQNSQEKEKTTSALMLLQNKPLFLEMKCGSPYAFPLNPENFFLFTFLFERYLSYFHTVFPLPLLLQDFSKTPLLTGIFPKKEFSPPKKKCSPWCIPVHPTIEIKGGYFTFIDPTMRNIYTQGGLDLQLSGTYPIWNWIQFYGSLEYLTRHGKSLNGNQKTSIWEIPLSIGLKSVMTIKALQLYATLGPRYFFIKAHNHSSYVNRHIFQNGLGVFANGGLHFIPNRHLLIDVFAEYSYERVHFSPFDVPIYGSSAQVGGFVLGGGLGYCF